MSKLSTSCSIQRAISEKAPTHQMVRKSASWKTDKTEVRLCGCTAKAVQAIVVGGQLSEERLPRIVFPTACMSNTFSLSCTPKPALLVCASDVFHPGVW